MRLIVTVVVCVLAPTVYTLLSLASVVPMTVPIFLGWLVWLQAVHVVAGVALWRRRATLSTRIKAALLSWGGLAVWYWLPAPVYFVLTMNLDGLATGDPWRRPPGAPPLRQCVRRRHGVSG